MLDILRAGIAATAIGLAIAPAAAEALTAPPGYIVVHSPLMPAARTTLDTEGQISSPAGTVVWGGGTVIAGIPAPVARVATPLPTTPLAQAIVGGGGMTWVSTIVSTSTQPVVDAFSTICAA